MRAFPQRPATCVMDHIDPTGLPVEMMELPVEMIGLPT